MSQLYINPVELLNLSAMPAHSLDAATIKKERRRFLNNLELDGGTLDYKGQRLDRSACERAWTDLDEPERLRVWHRLANMPALNDFLANGRPDFMLDASHAAALASDDAFIDLVGGRYAEQYSKALLAAFKANDSVRLQKIVAAPVLYPYAASHRAHAALNRLLQDKIDEIDELTEALDEDESETQALAVLRQALKNVGWTAMLTALPGGVFGGVRSQLVMAVRNFSIHFFNTYFSPAPAIKLLQEASTLQVDQQTTDKIREDLRQIKEIEVKQQARAKVDAVASRFGQSFDQLLAYQNQVAAGTANMYTVKQWGVGLSGLITELNSITDTDIAAARDTLALGLRGLSVAIWNKNQANGDTALSLLSIGLTVKATAATRAKLEEDKAQLNRMLLPVAPIYRPTTTVKQASSSSGISGWVWAIIGFVVLVFLMNTCSKSSSSSSTNPPAADYTSTEPTTSSNDASTTTGTESSTPETPVASEIPAPTYEPEVSKYAGNQLRNGASPLDNCFGKGRYKGPCWVNFKNDNNGTDAIVCLARNSDNKVIRNEYIRAGTSFRMSRIPAGTYYLKVFYGRDWNPTRRSACGTKGYFDTDQHFSESRGYGDLVTIVNDGYTYTTGTMTLYTVAGGNMAQQNINADEFFRQ